MTPDEVRAWVERSRRAQGLPEKVTDPATIARLAVLFGAPPRTPQDARETASRAKRRPADPGRPAGR